jgi:hypothetical protein
MFLFLISSSGLVQLGCLFFPKLYIVLFKPAKNTKEVVMAQHRSSSYLANPTPTNATPVAVVVNGMCPHILLCAHIYCYAKLWFTRERHYGNLNI